ncbi:hypothetical protein CXG81DRAFT_28916 [Caulochytrium protostelioides]|uniref:AB hydrolase-1 domain-containing protein n=1 Tax=Caulochytrium protostelioides TaxID=1555241 RepID=A0A4P9X0L0_9FUNG|nr:hypothetical protein CXG81DRAFT_28916 [Caulochytrium protostelioides]|eukprot:RKO98253.1 hypothetical protein CXG81DRAFT_28916 [Caulochytrium protostelioides]
MWPLNRLAPNHWQTPWMAAAAVAIAAAVAGSAIIFLRQVRAQHAMLRALLSHRRDLMASDRQAWTTRDGGHALAVYYRSPPGPLASVDAPAGNGGAPLLIVLIHGMGGQATQYAPYYEHFSRSAAVLTLDLLGHGESARASQADAYTTDRIVGDLCDVVCHPAWTQRHLLLVGHSYGAHLAVLLRQRLDNLRAKHETASPADRPALPVVAGLVLLCPKLFVSMKERAHARQLRRLPRWLITLMRWWDRRGGVRSTSVARQVHPAAPPSVRATVLAFNAAFETCTLVRVAAGALPAPPGVHERLANCATAIVVGEADRVTPAAQEGLRMQKLLEQERRPPEPPVTWPAQTAPSVADGPVHTYTVVPAGHAILVEAEAAVIAAIEGLRRSLYVV